MPGLSVTSLARLLRSSTQRQLSQKGRSGEAGAVASIVAMLFGMGVLLGVGALVIDTGSLLYERRQLQTGADAAVLSIAKTCLDADRLATLCAAPDISISPPSLLVALAGANAADKKTDIVSVCGSAALVLANPVAFPTTCPTPGTPGLVECPHTPSTGKYVEVRTSTRSGDGTSTILPPILAQTLAGAGGQYSGDTVKACARATWGKAGLHPPVIPFTLSQCDWYLDTANGTFFPPNPPYTAANPIDPTWEKALTFNGASDATCAAWQGHNYPGGFGWLTHTPTCFLTVPPDHWVEGNTGIGAGNDCGPKIEYSVGHVVFLPIFDCTDSAAKILPCQGNMPSGANTWYHLVKLAGFYITAVDVTGQVKANLPGFPTAASKTACNAKGGKCIYGWFLTKGYDPGASVDENGDLSDPTIPTATQLSG